MKADASLWAKQKCKACEGGALERLDAKQAQEWLAALPRWSLAAEGKRLRREWRVKDFLTALEFFRLVGELAEQEGHHPDLHLVGYRNVTIEIWTHALGGLSENDFILAAKIDTLPVELKS